MVSMQKAVKLLMIGLFVSRTALADCRSDANDFSSSCNSECPMDVGAPACHLSCHAIYTVRVAACPPEKPTKDPSSNKFLNDRSGVLQTDIDPKCLVDGCPDPDREVEAKNNGPKIDPKCLVDGCPEPVPEIEANKGGPKIDPKCLVDGCPEPNPEMEATKGGPKIDPKCLVDGCPEPNRQFELQRSGFNIPENGILKKQP